MDVHPPHEPIHSWRDFFTHLITITIGLLIALGLEAMVEQWHYHHLVLEARETIHSELRSNHRLVDGNLKALRADDYRLQANLKMLTSLRSGQKATQGSLMYALSWSSFGESAWRTAQSSGALSHMPYSEAQELSEVYAQQDFLDSLVLDASSKHTLAIAPLYISGSPNSMSREEIQICLQRTADLLLDIRTLQQLLTQVDSKYQEALKAR